MVARIEEKGGQDLPEHARIAVHDDASRHVEDEAHLGLLEPRSQAGDDLVGRFAQVEQSPVGLAAVDGDLFERLNKLPGPVQIGHELTGRVPVAVHELDEAGAPDRPGLDLPGELLASPGKARGHREADPDRVVDLVRDARDEAAQCGQLLGFNQARLRRAQLGQSSLGLLL